MNPFALAYRKGGSSRFWPQFHKGDPVPQTLWYPSERRNARFPSVVGVGVLDAVGALLTGEVQLGREGDAVSVRYTSSGDRSEARVCVSKPDGAERVWFNAYGAQGPTLLVLAEMLLLGRYPELRPLWDAFLLTVGETRYPCRASDLNRADQDQVGPALLALMDGVYYRGHKEEADDRAFDDAFQPMLSEVALADVLRPKAPKSTFPLVPQLTLLAKCGGRASNVVLYGPTATFKTESVKAAAREAGARVVAMNGRPSMSDRDILGEPVVVGQSVSWSDGPLSKAMRSALTRKTVLQIDELLRFDPFYLNTLVGALDLKSAEDVADLALDVPPQPGPYYVLELPKNRETLVVPSCNLSVFATTNIGGEYVQPADELDPALARRLPNQIEVPYPERDVLEPLYLSVCADVQVVEALFTLAAFVEANTASAGGAYRSVLHPGLGFNFLNTFQMHSDNGASKQEAFRAACEMTLVTPLCPREPDGSLDVSAQLKLRHRAHVLANGLT